MKKETETIDKEDVIKVANSIHIELTEKEIDEETGEQTPPDNKAESPDDVSKKTESQKVKPKEDVKPVPTDKTTEKKVEKVPPTKKDGFTGLMSSFRSASSIRLSNRTARTGSCALIHRKAREAAREFTPFSPCSTSGTPSSFAMRGLSTRM